MFDSPKKSVDSEHESLVRTADAAVAQALKAGPSARSVALLCSVAIPHLSPSGRLDFIRAWEQITAWSTAQSLPAIVDHVGTDPVDDQTGRHPAGDEAAIEVCALTEEIRLALALSPVATNGRIELARQLCGPLARTRTELCAGRISVNHARVIVDACRPLSDGDKPLVETRALDRAGHRTPGEFRRACRAAVDAIDPEATLTRHQLARAGRNVQRWQLPDGMACLQVEAPGPEVETIYGALSVLAGPTDSEDHRTVGARRFDALLGLCLGEVAPDPAAEGAEPATVTARPRVPVQAHIVIDLATMLGLAENPCELRGFGQIPASLAHAWLWDATTWRRLVTDPVDGHLLDYGPVVRSAPPKLRDYLAARYLTCVFPGCNRQAACSDLDHEPPWRSDGSGGHASALDLRPLCRRHHNLKTFNLWEMQHFGTTGTSWISPSGRKYEKRPPPVLTEP